MSRLVVRGAVMFDARLDGDLVGVGFHGDLSGLAGVRQPDLDLLPADVAPSGLIGQQREDGGRVAPARQL